ncbi:MAG: S8 family serine peptidase [Melioribacteraceae bacterium]|nr:S8 family serine peptidase [Melioribacteraceae bacterium]
MNLSLGSVTGNKGTSLYEEALTNMVEPGRLIVASAGNSGSSNIHLKYEMSGSSLSEATQTFWVVGNRDNQNTYIVGYPQSNNYTFGVKVYSEDASQLYYTSPEVSYGDSESNLLLVVEGDTLGVVTIDGRPQQGEPFANFIHLQYSSDANVDDYLFSYYTYGSSTLNAWIVNGSFSTDSDPANNIVGGDNLMTVGSPSSAFNVFSIGAFTTKTSWENFNGTPYSVNGTIEDRAPFSSIGPLRDGRIKPDFSAPGHLIAAGYSSDANLNPATVLNDQTVLMQGTSMSAPHFTGVIALLLEQNPNLSYEEAFEVLQNTSVSDGLTGAVPNNEFGHGRVDAHAALQQLITSVENEEIPLEYNLSQNYPNPFNPSTIIEYSVPQNEYVSIKVYDLLGRDVATLVNETKSAGTYKVNFDGRNLSSGIYFYKINAGSFNTVRKMMLLK